MTLDACPPAVLGLRVAEWTQHLAEVSGFGLPVVVRVSRDVRAGFLADAVVEDDFSPDRLGPLRFDGGWWGRPQARVPVRGVIRLCEGFEAWVCERIPPSKRAAAVAGVLVHEFAHLLVDQVAEDLPAHGSLWRRKFRDLVERVTGVRPRPRRLPLTMEAAVCVARWKGLERFAERA